MPTKHRFALQTPHERIVEAVVAVVRDGMSQMDAHRTYSVPRRTLQRYIERARADLANHGHQAKPSASPVSAGAKRVLVIGDTHDAPHLSKERFNWFGRVAVDEGVDQVVQIGDIGDFNSLNGHESNETWAGRAKPTFQQDCASLNGALDEFEDGLRGAKIPKHLTWGNHEWARALRFENNNPEVFGMMRDELLPIVEGHGWTHTPFGQYWTWEGVDFCHAPISAAGKPMGGINVADAAARDACNDLVFGHTHKRGLRRRPKLNHRWVTALEAGCALPQDMLERYVGHSMHGWDWGVHIVTIRDGRIENANWLPMHELGRRYGGAA